MEVKSILLVEDDSFFAKFFARKLSQIGDFKINHCISVESALEFIETNKPEIIFLDHELGGINGVDAIYLFQEAVPNVEISIVSGQRDPQVLGKALDSQVKYFRKNALLMSKTKDFISEIELKSSAHDLFWLKFLSFYTMTLTEHK